MPTLQSSFRSLLPSGLSGYMALASSILSIILTIVLVALVHRQATEHFKQNIGSSLAGLAEQTPDKLDRGKFRRHREGRRVPADKAKVFLSFPCLWCPRGNALMHPGHLLAGGPRQ